MYVARLRIDGVRGFYGPRAADLDFSRPNGTFAGWTVLAGRNGSGKSTLLRSIALCLAGGRRASQLDDTLEDWLTDSRENGSIETLLIGQPTADTGLPPGPDSTHRVQALWRPEQDPPIWLVDNHNGTPTEVIFTAEKAIEQLLWRAAPPGWFYAAYGPFRRLSGTPAFERSAQSSDRTAAVRTLFEEQSALTEAVDWLVMTHLHRLEEEQAPEAARRGARDLLHTVTSLLNDGLLPDGYVIERVDSDGLWLRRDAAGMPRPLHRTSDGLRTVTALVLDIVRQMHAAYGKLDLQWRDDDGSTEQTPFLPHPGVVLIDEVDAHLHVSWQQRLGGWLKQHFPAVQFIVTTHSPYICQAADEGGLIRLAGPDQALPPEPVEPESFRRIVYGTGDDAVLSDLFGLDSPYSQHARELRSQLAELELAVVTGRADEQDKQRYRQLRDQLASSPVARVDEVTTRLDLSRERDR